MVLAMLVGACGGEVSVAPGGTTASGIIPPQTCVDVCRALEGCWTDSAEACSLACAKRAAACAEDHDAFLACVLERATPSTCDPYRPCGPGRYAACEGDPTAGGDCEAPGEHCCVWYQTQSGHELVTECDELGDECSCLVDGRVFAHCKNQPIFSCEPLFNCCHHMFAIHGLSPPG
jgi:hypothetical protein